jgi:uncharacterized protein YegP (UPF0339 family)
MKSAKIEIYSAKIEIYQDSKKDWRLRMVAPNGRILLVSSEGYKRELSALNLTKYFAPGIWVHFV